MKITIAGGVNLGVYFIFTALSFDKGKLLTRSIRFLSLISALSVPAVVVGNRRGDMKVPLSFPDSH
jgi:hypothetical protein